MYKGLGNLPLERVVMNIPQEATGAINTTISDLQTRFTTTFVNKERKVSNVLKASPFVCPPFVDEVTVNVMERTEIKTPYIWTLPTSEHHNPL